MAMLLGMWQAMIIVHYSGESRRKRTRSGLSLRSHNRVDESAPVGFY